MIPSNWIAIQIWQSNANQNNAGLKINLKYKPAYTYFARQHFELIKPRVESIIINC